MEINNLTTSPQGGTVTWVPLLMIELIDEMRFANYQDSEARASFNRERLLDAT